MKDMKGKETITNYIYIYIYIGLDIVENICILWKRKKNKMIRIFHFSLKKLKKKSLKITLIKKIIL